MHDRWLHVRVEQAVWGSTRELEIGRAPMPVAPNVSVALGGPGLSPVKQLFPGTRETVKGLSELNIWGIRLCVGVCEGTQTDRYVRPPGG